MTYQFKAYAIANVGATQAHILESVTLQYQEAILTNYESSSSTWTYDKIKQSHVYVPENKILIPLSNNGAELKAYAELHKNSFFPPDLLGKPWLPALIYWSAFRIEFNTARVLPQQQRRFQDPKPPDRWVLTFNFTDGYRVRPSYEDLITGYSRDPRSIPDKIRMTSQINQTIKLEYYRNNPYEQIPNLEYIDGEAEFVEPIGNGIDPLKSRLKSIDWTTQTVSIEAGKPLIVDITGIVLGTLYIAETTTIQSYTDDASKLLYGAKYLLNNIVALDELFDRWGVLYNDRLLLQIYGQVYLDKCKLTDKKLRFAYTGFGFNSGMVSLAISEGYNNKWNNYQLPNYQNYLVNPNIIEQFKVTILKYHPFFKSLPLAGDSAFATNPDPNFRRFDKVRENYYPFNHANLIKWQLKPQIDTNNKFRGIGSLIMDGIRTIEIHAALNAGKWGVNPDDGDEPRKDDLGWRIQRTNEVLGIRVGTDGKFDPAKEKKIVRQVIPAKQKLDPEKVGINNFGDGGMVVKRINNRFNGDKIESDQCVIIHDLLQLIQEYHEQHNLAIGLQESSAIEIKDPKDDKGKNKARFDNQLGLLLEIFNLLSSANEMTRANLISSLITQSQTSEVIAGLGLPSVTKTIPIKIDKEVTQLPYKGIAPHRSISQEVATCTANVGIVLGQLL